MFWKRRTYLDYAAGVRGNPSSPHEEGRLAKKMLEDARTAIARLTEVQPDDVLFTSGATESNALAILGHVRALRLLAGPDVPGRNNMHVLYLSSSHASIVENMNVLAREGITIEALPVKDYRIDSERLAAMIRKETVLVSMDAVCGETGVVWNTREVAETLRKARGDGVAARIMLHVDASQAPLTEKISRAHFGADMLTFDASKVSAARGIGMLIAHRTIPLVPLYAGGGQERGLRSGSEAPELAQSFAAALAAAVLGRESFRVSAEKNRTLLKAALTAILNIHIQEGRSQAPHILNLSLPGRDTDYIVALLDEAGFAISSRSACETDSEEGSRAVLALTGDPERARATLRISWGPDTYPRELARFAKALIRAVAFIDNSNQG
ncbi:MAG: aminotransferase class V-fold PLP-dependent enzyme [Candidatus Kaiserbacteria bacterium]|nr:aminotransferase class V-fold PLP-dependent enzyme [Candidatus Kaiserbacteria bacterium]